MSSTDESHPTLLHAPISSSLRKARIRAKLFRTKVPPVRIGRFILVERLAAGAMGEIYAALDEQLDRRVALKLVRHGSDLEGEELLIREAQALAQVSHPNVVQVYETGIYNGRAFIAMELVHGETLTRWLMAAGRMPRRQRHREILRQFIAAGRGLEAIHAAGVTHRDFKPDNVLVSIDGRVRVVDFGLAGVVSRDRGSSGASESSSSDGPPISADGLEHGEIMRIDRVPSQIGDAISVDSSATAASPIGVSEPASAAPTERTGDAETGRAMMETPRLAAAVPTGKPALVMGTVPYMAPEQMRGTMADHRSDQFGFCVALYHALCGAFPFAGDRMPEILASIEKGNGLEYGAGVATRVRKALRRGLSADPSRRFANMGELLAVLEPSITRRNRWFTAATVLLAGLAAVAYFVLSNDPCSRVDDGIASSWSGERQEAIQTAFSRSELPYAEVGWRSVKTRLDSYVGRWRGEAIAACRAAQIERTQSEEQFDRRMLCLERDRNRLESLISELSAPAPDAVQHAVEAADELPDVHACSHTESMMFGLEPPPDAVAAEVSVIRGTLARARTASVLGRTEESLVIARDARKAAERLKYLPLRAEALYEVARALDGRSTKTAREEAERLYFDALDITEAVRYDQLTVSTWSRLVLLASWQDPGTQRAHSWWRRYQAAVHRTGDSAYEQANLHHMLGELYSRDGKFAEAADEENHAITLLSKAPEQQLELSRYYDALANALDSQDRLDEGLRLHEQALQIASEALGPSHPDVIKYQANYSIALEKTGQFARARSVLQAALASMPAKYRDSHLDAGKLHAFLSDVSYMEGKLDDAVAHARESLQIYQRSGAPEDRVAEAYTNLGNVEMRRKKFAEAIIWYRQALEIRLPILGHEHYLVGYSEGSIAEALVRLSRYDEALPHAREAKRILDLSLPHDRAAQMWIGTVYGQVLVGQRQFVAAIATLEPVLPLFEGVPDTNNQAFAKWALARALQGVGKDAGRVRQLADEARILFANMGERENLNRKAVEQFLKRLPPVTIGPSANQDSTR